MMRPRKTPAHEDAPETPQQRQRRQNREAQLRFQARARKGQRLGRFVISAEWIEWLVANDYLPETGPFDPAAIEHSTGLAHAAMMQGMQKRFSS